MKRRGGKGSRLSRRTFSNPIQINFVYLIVANIASRTNEARVNYHSTAFSRATCLMSNSVDRWVSGSAVVCNGIPGLTKDQRELCHRNPDVTVAAIKGLQLAISECQHQFTWHRWNCSSLTPNSRTQQSSVLLQRGTENT